MCLYHVHMVFVGGGGREKENCETCRCINKWKITIG